MLAIPPGAKRLSSNSFEYRRRAFPYLWFGLLTLFAVRMWIELDRDVMVPFLAVVVFVALTGYLVISHFNRHMVDDVWDDGKGLVVQKDGEVDHVPMADILRIRTSLLVAPRRVTIVLRKPGKWGDRIVFSMRFSWLAGIREYPEIRDLAARAAAARGAALS